MRRILGVTAMAAALAVVLSGCSLWQDGEKVVGQLQEGFVAHQVLTELTDELRALDDVETAESSVVPVFMTAGVTVVLRAGVPARTVGEIATRVDEVLRGPDLQPFEREFSVRAGEAGITQTSFDRSPVDYAAELAYWGLVQSAVGTGLTLTLGADRAGEFQRILSTGTDATVATLAENYDAVAGIDPPAGTPTMWRLPGILGYADWLGPLPERSILTFMADMAGVTNLLDDSVQEMPPGFYVVLPQSGSSFPARFAVVANAPGTEVDAAATWRLVLRMTRGALATGLPAFQVAVQSYGDGSFADANFHVGECADLHPPTAADRKLVADLVADGIQLPGSAAGICIAFATP